eukprot:GFYU01005351.1.p1 GENE.GFYU01005351.1~~GFYU01005351.1.p1  ORF type:complete len:330 (-),score=63.87 GFYU01005351.1:287-1276(-)
MWLFALFLLYTLSFVCLLVWSVVLVRQNPKPTTFFLPCIIVGFIYENFLLLVGAGIGNGKMLRTLYWIQFLWSDFFYPFIFLHAASMAERSRVQYMKKLRWSFRAATLVITAIGIVCFWYDVANLKPVQTNEILRYVSTGDYLVQLMPQLVVWFATLVVGALIWKQSSVGWLFGGTLVTILMNMIPDNLPTETGSRVHFYMDSVAEMVFVASILLTERKVQQEEWVYYVISKLETQDLATSFMTDDLFTYESDANEYDDLTSGRHSGDPYGSPSPYSSGRYYQIESQDSGSSGRPPVAVGNGSGRNLGSHYQYDDVNDIREVDAPGRKL